MNNVTYTNNDNIIPLPELDGLSFNQFKSIAFENYSISFPIQIHKNISNDILDQIPFLKLTEVFLKIIQREKVLKLTPTFSLQVKVVKELYDMRIILDEQVEHGTVKKIIESEIVIIHNLHIICKLSGLIKKKNNTLTLTSKGTNLIKPENRKDLFETIFLTFAFKFNLDYNDGYDDNITGIVARMFIIKLLLSNSNNLQNASYYAYKFLYTMPGILDLYDEKSEEVKKRIFLRCFNVRMFERFFNWFGFTETKQIGNYLESTDDYQVKVSPMLKDIFYIK